GGGHLGYLWYTEGFEPQHRSSLPTSKLFAGKGNMIMRSDWKDSGSILNFKCGPNSNHYHLDQGTILLMSNGEMLLNDAGHSSSYYANLYYPCYYTQAIGHNVLLLDKNPESQGIADYENGVAALQNYPKITRHFASDIADEVEGDLTCVYKGALSGYTRSLLYMKPEIIYLFDKVKSEKGHEYTWLFHAEHTDEKNSITYNDNRITITRPKANLTMDVIAPRIASHTIRDSDRDEGFIMLSSEEGQTESAFLAVLSPSAGTNPTSITSTLIRGDGWTGARSVLKSTVAVGMFSLDGREKGLDADGIQADAERCVVVIDKEGRVEQYYIHGQNMNVSGKRPALFFSNKSISAAVMYGEKGSVDIDIDAPEETSVSFSVYRKPSAVLLNGAEIDRWQYNEQGKRIVLEIPAGRTALRVR
ncbi:heparinase II/III family protein, partial [Candidatus Omnitrophota bacterium]